MSTKNPRRKLPKGRSGIHLPTKVHLPDTKKKPKHPKRDMDRIIESYQRKGDS